LQEVEWEHVLSLGEQQRLGLARMYYHSPQFGERLNAFFAMPLLMKLKTIKLPRQAWDRHGKC
jgi:hypothetical protein